MTQPIVIEVRSGSAYIRYTDAESDSTVDLNAAASVAADLDQNGVLVGFEIHDIASADQLAIAAAYAAEHGAAFPRDLSGALASA